MTDKQTFKEYLVEYFSYITFPEIVDKEDGTDAAENKSDVADDLESEPEKSYDDNCKDLEKGDGEEDYNPCKLLQYLRLANAANN